MSDNIVQHIAEKSGTIMLSGLFSSLIAYKEQLTIAVSIGVFIITILTFIINAYYQFQRNKREEQEALRQALVFSQAQEDRFIEKRLGIEPDNKKRRRKTDVQK